MKAIRLTALLIFATTVAFAQKWEFGADGAVGLLNSVAVSGAATGADAGFAPGFIAGASVGEKINPHFSGEIRYEFMQSNLRLSSSGQNAQFTGSAHALHYDVVYRTNRGESATQFFGAVGGGVKAFLGTGTEAAYQPLSQFGYFTKTNTMKPLLTVAVGFTYRLSPKLSLRMEVRDYMTGFPTAVLTPPQGVKYGSPLNEIAPIVGIAYVK